MVKLTQVSGGTHHIPMNGAISSTSASISGLTAGTYTVTISDNSSPPKDKCKLCNDLRGISASFNLCSTKQSNELKYIFWHLTI